MKKIALVAGAAFLTLATPVQAAIQAVMHKMPDCGCCEGHAEHLRKNGFQVKILENGKLAAFRKARGVPESQAGCHTILIGNYVIEGHVPAAAIKKLLAEKPKIKGISVPGMPSNSPGMERGKMPPSTLNVYAIGSGTPKIFMKVRMPGGTFPG